MTQVLITETYLEDIADAIREKNGSESTYTPAQMAAAIENIPSAEEPDLVSKSITANGTYDAEDDGHDGYSDVTVNVPNSYAATDEGKVVSNGALVTQTSTTKDVNGTYDTTLNNEVVVDVPNTYTAADEGKVVSEGELVTQGELEITENGTFDTTLISQAVVNVEDKELREMVYNVYPTEQAQGNPASFDDGAEGVPVKDLKVTIEPRQDLHGYDHPWPAGGGKNLFKYPYANASGTYGNVQITVNSDGSLTLNGTANADALFYFHTRTNDDYPFILPIGNYTLTGVPTGYSAYNLRIGYNKGSSGSTIGSDTGSGVAITENDGTNQYGIWLGFSSGVVFNNLKIYPMIRLASESDATFEPYSNICPITGHTGITVTKTGFNVWDEEWEVGAINAASGVSTDFANRIRSKNFCNIIGGQTYYKYFGSSETLRVFFYDEDKNYISYTQGVTFVAPANAYFFKVSTEGSTYGETYKHDICINISDSAKNGTYEPGHVVVYSITFPSEAGAVYGGTLDVTTGVLTVDRAIVDLGTLTWTRNTSDYSYAYFYSNGLLQYSQIPLVCSHYPFASGGKAGLTTDKTIAYYSTASTRMAIRDDSYTDAVAFKTAMSGVQCVYPLLNPQTYQLTPQEVLTVLGTNHISTDAESVDVEYRADIKLYIEQLTKPEEDDLVANQAIEAGKFFMIGNRLFLSTASIANGATINPGTNCTELSLSDALNNLNS